MKSYQEFVNENLFGQFNYYGNGSLFPLIKKLKDEGKSIDVIVTYMRSLGIDEQRQRDVLSKLFHTAICNEALLNENTKNITDDKLAALQNVIDDEEKFAKIQQIIAESALN